MFVSLVFSRLDDVQQEQFVSLWSDFSDMWSSEDEASVRFVVDFISKEMRLEYSDVETLIDEYQKEPSPSAPVPTTQVIAVNESKPPDVRKDLLDNLIKVRFARERKLLYGEVVDMRSLDSESIKITHPRLYSAALNDAESLMKGIDPVDNLIFINDVSTGLVREIVDVLRDNDALSVTTIIKLMKRRYSTWNIKIRNTLDWLVQQGLVSRVGLSRYTLRVEDSNSYQLSSLEQRILSNLDSRKGKNKTLLFRDLGVINHKNLRSEVNSAITQLEDRGYIFRGAYNRLLKCVPQVGEAS
tara:strand:+ start:214 stop:1110 length:897 start_codon:yes stop_codon:yes gene_type:complete